MRKYILLVLSFIMLICSISIVANRVIIPNMKNKDFEENEPSYDYEQIEAQKEKEKIENALEKPVITLTGEDNEIVQLTIGAYMSRVSNKQYELAYDFLATSFKETNFKTLEEYRNFIDVNYPGIWILEYESYRRVNDIIICKVKMKDYKDRYDEIEKIFTIVKEGDSYKLSFGLGEENEE